MLFRWGTIYDNGDEKVRSELLQLAVEKLLGAHDIQLDTMPKCIAVLSQRLALDINSTGYVLSPHLSHYETTMEQITNHMRICVEIGVETETIRSIASSEPILSEAASSIMRQNPKFNLAETLSHILTGFSINSGDRGELLVAALFTLARDAVIAPKCPPGDPKFSGHHFSVTELFSCLFKTSLLDTMPSICPSGVEQLRLEKIARTSGMHFNHFIKAQEHKVISHQYLTAFIARGAAILGANCQPGLDAVFPYLFGNSSLEETNVGFILVQVKNDAKYSRPNTELFRSMDPFKCGLFNDSCIDGCFSIPIIRIVFALRGRMSGQVTPMTYSKPSKGANPSHFTKAGQPRFTSYDYWCSGIGPNLRPVGTDDKWKGLLNRTDPWPYFYSHSPAPDVLRSEFPAGLSGASHFDRWYKLSSGLR
jgi:hypothetical protein